jgi:hypothetical protein
MGYDFEDAAEGVSGFKNLVDFLLHALLNVRVGAVEKNLFTIVEATNFFPRDLIGQGDAAGGDNVTEDFDAEVAEEEFGDGAQGYPGSGLAGRGAFEDVASLGEVVLQGSGKIGVARTGRGNTLVLCRIALADGQGFLPVLPVAVLKLNGYG